MLPVKARCGHAQRVSARRRRHRHSSAAFRSCAVDSAPRSCPTPHALPARAPRPTPSPLLSHALPACCSRLRPQPLAGASRYAARGAAGGSGESKPSPHPTCPGGESRAGTGESRRRRSSQARQRVAVTPPGQRVRETRAAEPMPLVFNPRPCSR
ncbi:unnamed protein product [Lampetra fluviatilis]